MIDEATNTILIMMIAWEFLPRCKCKIRHTHSHLLNPCLHCTAVLDDEFISSSWNNRCVIHHRTKGSREWGEEENQFAIMLIQFPHLSSAKKMQRKPIFHIRISLLYTKERKSFCLNLLPRSLFVTLTTKPWEGRFFRPTAMM